MLWNLIPFLLLHLTSTVLAAGIALQAWRRRSLPGALPLATLMGAIAIWNLGAAGETTSSGLAASLMWTRIQYLGIVTVPGAWLLFVWRGVHRAHGSWLSALLVVEPLAALALMWTNATHGLWWRHVATETRAGMQVLAVQFGPAFWGHAGYSYGVIAAATVLLGVQTWRAGPTRRRRLGAMLASSLAPWLGNSLYLSGFLGHFDPTPVTFALVGMVHFWALYGQLPTILPVAEKLIIESIDDAIVVLDADGHVSFANAASRKLFHLGADLVGRSLASLPGGDDIVGSAQHSDDFEICLEVNAHKRHFQVRALPVDAGGALGGQQLFILHDRTSQWRVAARMRGIADIRHALSLMDQSEDVDQVIRATARALETMDIPIYSCGLNLVDPTQDPLRFRQISVRTSGCTDAQWSDARTSPLLTHVWHSRQSLYRTDLFAQDRYQERQGLPVDIRSVLDVPFSHGTLAVNSYLPDAFPPDTIAALEEVAAVLSHAFQRRDHLRERARQTARLEAEVAQRREVQRSLQQTSEIINRSPVVGFLWAHDPGSPIEFVTDNVVDLLGYSAAELVTGQVHYLDLIHAEDQTRVQREMNHFLQEGTADTYVHPPYRVITRDGVTRWVEERTHLQRNDAGGVMQHQSIIIDVTRRQELEEERLRLSEAVRHSPVSIVITDPNGRIEYVNPFFSQITGYSAQEAIGRNPRILASGKVSRDVYSDLWKRILSGKIWNGRFINVKKSGDEYIESARIAPIIDESGTIRHFVAIKEDITQLWRAQQELRDAKEVAEEASRAKSEFVANMSHEIRTPLGAVIGLADLLLETDLNATQRQYLETIRSSSRALEEIINDVLDFSRVEAGRLEIEEIDFSLRDRLEEAVRGLSLQAREKGLELTCQLDASVPERAVGDPLRLWQVVVNLLGNAIKFTEQGSVALHATMVPTGEGKGLLEVTVTDTGIGIPADRLQDVFQDFVQADARVTRQYGGTGLGLAICTRLVHLMGGEIRVESEEGVGSSFAFTIALKPAAQPATARADSKERDGSGIRPLQVLVAEDTLANQLLIRATLERRGHHVTLTDRGEAAVRAFAGQRYDIVLMDLHMPDMDGFEATRQIRAVEGDSSPSQRTPILALTALSAPDVEERCADAGMDGVVRKPFHPARLRQIVENAAAPAAQPDNDTISQEEPNPASPEVESFSLLATDLLEQMDGDRNLMGKLAQALLEQCAATPDKLAAAIAQEDCATVAKVAHSFKGALGLIGPNPAFDAAELLETAGREHEIGSLASLAAALNHQVELLSAALRAFV